MAALVEVVDCRIGPKIKGIETGGKMSDRPRSPLVTVAVRMGWLLARDAVPAEEAYDVKSDLVLPARKVATIALLALLLEDVNVVAETANELMVKLANWLELDA